jgi:hypothetical protein
VSAGACVRGSVSGLLSSGVHRVGPSQELLGSPALGSRGSLIEDRGRSIEVGLLVIQEQLMFVTRALGVVEHVLRRGAPRLRKPGLGLAGLLCGVAAGVFGRRVDLGVELGLFVVEASLFAVSNCLLAITERLLETSDALISVKAVLRAV